MIRPWMPFYIDDFRLDTLELRIDEMGVYLVMLCLAWRRNGPLPGDDETLKRMLKACFSEFHGHSYNRIVPKLLARYFYRDDEGSWRQKRLEVELEKSRKLSAKQAQTAGKRWAKQVQNNVEINEINDIENATVMPRARVLQPHRESSLRSDSMDSSLRSESNTPSQKTSRKLIREKPSSLEILQTAPLSEKTAQDLIDHRKAKRAPLTPRAAEGLVAAFRDHGDPELAAEAMIVNGWQGFKPEWMAKKARDGPNGHQGPITAFNRPSMRDHIRKADQEAREAKHKLLDLEARERDQKNDP